MTVRVEHIGDATLYLGDNASCARGAAADLCFTSPPYAQQRNYGAGIGDWDALMRGAFSGIGCAEDAQVIVNLGLVHRDGECVEYWRDWLDWMRGEGWRFFGWYVWDQGPGMPGDWQGRLAPAHEFLFHFNRSARKPNKTVPCRYAGHVRSKPQGGLRLPTGDMSGWSHGLAPTNENKIPDSVIRVMRHKHAGGIEAGHPAVFPVDLAEEIVGAYTRPGDTVLDPFMGSGSTGVACARLGRRFVGIEIHEPYFDIACRRIEEAQRQGDLLRDVLPAAKPVQEVML
jgi:DNA modification methylase